MKDLKNKLAGLDKAVKEIEDKRKATDEELEKVVKRVKKIDDEIAIVEARLARLELNKQDALDIVRDEFELYSRTYFRLADGYEVKFHGKRPIEITDIKAFMKWLKANIPAEEVAEFFSKSLIKKELQNFIELWCDSERSKGVMNPTVDGINIGVINFRRLRTSLTKKERKK